MSKPNDYFKVTRNFEFDIRAENNEEHGDFLTGRAIVYDTPTDIGGWYREFIDNGALDRTDLKDVRLLVNHNTSMIPLARSRNNNGNSTMFLSVDEKGLSIRADLDTANNTDAKNLYSAASRGDISGMSFAFTVNGERWDDLETDYPTRHITSIGKVFEVSAVTFPAYESTDLQARDAEALERAKAALESAKAAELEQNRAALVNKLSHIEEFHKLR